MLSARRSKEQAAGGRQWRCGGRDSVFGEGLGPWVGRFWDFESFFVPPIPHAPISNVGIDT